MRGTPAPRGDRSDHDPPACGPARGRPRRPARPGDSGPAGPQRIRAARAASASPEYRSTSPPGPPCSVCWPPGSVRSPCLSSTPAGPWRGYLAAAAGLVVVLLGSMAAHELAHSIVARRYGLAGAGHRRLLRRAAARPGVPARIGLRAGVAQRPRPVAGRRGRAPGQPAAGRARRGRSGHLVRARRRPAAGSRGRGRGLDQRPAGGGQPRAGGGAGWRADRPSARVGALGRSHRAGLVAARFGQVSGAIPPPPGSPRWRSVIWPGSGAG